MISDLPPAPPGKSGWPWTANVEHPWWIEESACKYPAITIVMPSYNQKPFIEESIRSIILQKYENLQFILIDAESDDGTIEIIKKYAKYIDKIVIERDFGQSNAINKGFSFSTGQIGTWLNTDDVFLPGALHSVARNWKLGRSLLIGKSEYRNETGDLTLFHVDNAPNYWIELFSYTNGLYVPQPSAFFSIADFKEVGGVSEKLHYAMDLDLWFRLMAIKKPVFVDTQYSWMRAHAAAKTVSSGVDVLNEVENVFDEHFLNWRDVFRSQADALDRRRVKCLLDSLIHGGKREPLKARIRAAWTTLRKDPYLVGSDLAKRVVRRVV